MRLVSEVGRRDASSSGGSRAGFSLLEVLAAVVILSIWYIVIANAAVRGLGREGESIRLMEAAMLADNVLAEIEATTFDGTAPEHMEDTREEEPYSVEISITAFGGGGFAAPGAPQPEPGPDAPPPGLVQRVNGEMPGVAAHLRTITVKVLWGENDRANEVVRTSYAFDIPKAVEALYPDGESGEAASDDDDPGQDDTNATNAPGSSDDDTRESGLPDPGGSN